MSDIVISTKPEEKSSDTSMVQEAESILSKTMKIKDANDKLEAEMKRTTELLEAKNNLAGRSYAGQVPPREKTPEEIAHEEAAAILKEIR